MMRICISLFLSGIVLGVGPCLASCGPLIISYIAGTKQGPKEGFISWFAFSLARLFAYVILALIIGLVSRIVVNSYQEYIGRYLYLAGGIFICLIGILMILGKGAHIELCGKLNKYFIERGVKSSFIFGLIIGFLPCAPLMSILAYISIISQNLINILLYSLSFSLGTVISPLLILTVAAGFIPHLFLKHAKYYRIFQAICGTIICVLGINLARNFWLL